ncbi:MAG: hypothetical protein OXF01_01825 [Gemmatimonadetes bacterium]|nr:hypothetical protein [Gemmatimonadota bacterium]
MSVLDLTVEQEGDSIYGAGLISGVILTDEETVWYGNDSDGFMYLGRVNRETVED